MTKNVELNEEMQLKHDAAGRKIINKYKINAITGEGLDEIREFLEVTVHALTMERNNLAGEIDKTEVNAPLIEMLTEQREPYIEELDDITYAYEIIGTQFVQDICSMYDETLVEIKGQENNDERIKFIHDQLVEKYGYVDSNDYQKAILKTRHSNAFEMLNITARSVIYSVQACSAQMKADMEMAKLSELDERKESPTHD